MNRLIGISVSAALAYLQAMQLAKVLRWSLPFKFVEDGTYREIASVGIWLGPIVALFAGVVVSRSRAWAQMPVTLALCPVVFWAYYAAVVSGEGLSVFGPDIASHSGTIFTTRALLLLGGGVLAGLVLATFITQVFERNRPKPAVR